MTDTIIHPSSDHNSTPQEPEKKSVIDTGDAIDPFERLQHKQIVPPRDIDGNVMTKTTES